jgi:hypothetical protein
LNNNDAVIQNDCCIVQQSAYFLQNHRDNDGFEFGYPYLAENDIIREGLDLDCRTQKE